MGTYFVLLWQSFFHTHWLCCTLNHVHGRHVCGWGVLRTPHGKDLTSRSLWLFWYLALNWLHSSLSLILRIIHSLGTYLKSASIVYVVPRIAWSFVVWKHHGTFSLLRFLMFNFVISLEKTDTVQIKHRRWVAHLFAIALMEFSVMRLAGDRQSLYLLQQ